MSVDLGVTLPVVPGRTRLARGCVGIPLALCVSCAVSVLWQQLLALLGLLHFPVAVPGRGCGAEGELGELEVSPGGHCRGSLPTLPEGSQLPLPCYSSYLFIEMSECDEVQKSKLAPERP